MLKEMRSGVISGMDEERGVAFCMESGSEIIRESRGAGEISLVSRIGSSAFSVSRGGVGGVRFGAAVAGKDKK